jgi:hypothetical protein
MENSMILNRLAAFEAELVKKNRDTGFTVNETRFICERARMLVRNYSRIGSHPVKEQTVAMLEAVLDQADLFYARYDYKKRQGPFPFTHVVDPAADAIRFFLSQMSTGRPMAPYVREQ